MLEKLIPIKKDLLLKETDLNKVEKRLVHVVTSKWTPLLQQSNEFRYYEVLDTGPEVMDVAIGDIVLVSWANTVPSFFWEGTKLTLTSEKHIIAVVETDD